ncbi:MAG: hypothetical protein KF705_05570 [Phycisphaeraceae bacterium]|nr:hypothetical protein [Phycisphaeraceae bacterium]
MAESLRRLASGCITNDQFEDALPAGMGDGEWAVFHAAWHCYDDFHEHRLRGAHRLTRLERQLFARCVLFLRSGLPYEWSEGLRYRVGIDPTAGADRSTPCRRSFYGLIAELFTRRHCDDEANDRACMARMIDDRIWPFYRRADLNAALRNPPYLAGCSV